MYGVLILEMVVCYRRKNIINIKGIQNIFYTFFFPLSSLIDNLINKLNNCCSSFIKLEIRFLFEGVHITLFI